MDHNEKRTSLFLGTQPQKQYVFRRVLLESLAVGCDVYLSEGELLLQNFAPPGTPPQIRINDQRKYEGWKHEKRQPS